VKPSLFQIRPAMKRISRRNLVLSAGSAALSLPFLRSLGASADETQPPKRLIIVYTANGTVPESFAPSALRSSTDFDLGTILEPLLAYKDRIVGMTGIHSAVGLSTYNRGGPHQRGIGSLFTGAFLQEGEFSDGCGATAGWANGPSIDQILAQTGLGDTPLRSLELGVRCTENDVQGRISYSGAGSPLPPINDPRLTFSRLFERPTEAPKTRDQKITNAVFDQWTSLRKRVGSEDGAKLDAHLELVLDLERRLQNPGQTSCDAPEAAATLNPDSEVDMPAVSRAQLDLIAAAFTCDLTRFVSLQYSTGFNRIAYPWLDAAGEGHSLSHSGDSNAEAMGALSGRMRWHASELAYLADKLAQIPEGEGSVLDSTLIVWATEVSKGNSHSLNDIPYLLIGNAQGAIRGGQWLNFPGRSGNDLLVTIARAFDLPLEQIGEAGFTDGPLDELLA
jgi:Protein of unknown function (DUF1552)